MLKVNKFPASKHLLAKLRDQTAHLPQQDHPILPQRTVSRPWTLSEAKAGQVEAKGQLVIILQNEDTVQRREYEKAAYCWGHNDTRRQDKHEHEKANANRHESMLRGGILKEAEFASVSISREVRIRVVFSRHELVRKVRGTCAQKKNEGSHNACWLRNVHCLTLKSKARK